MRFLHISDLHIGKKVNEFSMIDDQIYILNEIFNIVIEHKVDAVLIAGDVYDKSIPPTQAVEVLDDFLVKLSKSGIKTFVISGNHDSPQRLAFGARLLKLSGIYVESVYDKNAKCITLNDDFGEINVYSLPFIKPIQIRQAMEDESINSYTEAVDTAIKQMKIDKSARNILITHQFVTGASRSDSEDISVGGTDNVDVTVFDEFDYVALGHIHAPQKISRDTIRYSGTPLKYSFSEAKHQKSVVVLDMNEKQNVQVKLVPLKPQREMLEIKGDYMTITSKTYRDEIDTDAYLHITLTDENDVPDAISKLRVIYPNIMRLDYDNKRTRENLVINADTNMKQKSPLELFCEFYKLQNNQDMSEEQLEFCEKTMQSIWEGKR